MPRRRLPAIDNALVNPNEALQYRPSNGYIRDTIIYQLITPLIGGGTESYTNDAHTFVRVSSIRGVLRFWWRATRGGLSRGDARHLRRLEARTWGGIGREHTAQAERCEIPVEANGVNENGVLAYDGYRIEWQHGRGFDVYHEIQNIFYDVRIDQSSQADRVLVEANDVAMVRADFDNNHRVTLVVTTGGTFYQLTVTDTEVMYPSQVKIHVDGVIANPQIITENSLSSALLPGANQEVINHRDSDLSYVLFPLRA